MTWDIDGWHCIPGALIAAWKKAYPRIDVEAELHKAHAWLLSNPKLVPRRNFTRFANTWLKKAKPEQRRATTYALRPEQYPEVIVP